jgi:hypothetical protein
MTRRNATRELSDSRFLTVALRRGSTPTKKVVTRDRYWFWRLLGWLTGMAQGAAQFCRREAFLALGGYDETIYMGLLNEAEAAAGWTNCARPDLAVPFYRLIVG